MAKAFFYVTGGICFLAVTVVVLWTTFGARQRFIAVAPVSGGLAALTENGDEFLGGAGNWKYWGNIRTATKGDPLGIK